MEETLKEKGDTWTYVGFKVKPLKDVICSPKLGEDCSSFIKILDRRIEECEKL